jgi:hypothetical protein
VGVIQIDADGAYVDPAHVIGVNRIIEPLGGPAGKRWVTYIYLNTGGSVKTYKQPETVLRMLGLSPVVA